MKISELKRIAKENDYEYSKHSITHIFTRENTDNYIRINSLLENGIWISNIYWCDSKDIKMIKAAVAFAETPIWDREEEKKFYLKHRWMTTLGGFPKGLRINIGTGTADVEQMIPLVGYKNQFTKKEIEEIKEKFNTDLADFKEVEVEE